MDPDAERPGFKVLTLCSNTSSSATFLQPASNTVPAAPGAELAVEPVAGPRFLQLLAEYKDRLIKHIVQGPNVDGCWGVELGKAGNPLGNFMTPELAEYKKQVSYRGRCGYSLGGSMAAAGGLLTCVCHHCALGKLHTVSSTVSCQPGILQCGTMTLCWFYCCTAWLYHARLCDGIPAGRL